MSAERTFETHRTFRTAPTVGELDEPEVSVTGVVAESDHAGDGEPAVGHPVLAVDVVGLESAGDTQYALCDQDRLLSTRVSRIRRNDRCDQHGQVRNGLGEIELLPKLARLTRPRLWAPLRPVCCSARIFSTR